MSCQGIFPLAWDWRVKSSILAHGRYTHWTMQNPPFNLEFKLPDHEQMQSAAHFNHSSTTALTQPIPAQASSSQLNSSTHPLSPIEKSAQLNSLNSGALHPCKDKQTSRHVQLLNIQWTSLLVDWRSSLKGSRVRHVSAYPGTRQAL